MRHTHIVISLSLALFLSFSSVASSQLPESVNGCHCFKDRTYNPSEKFASDDYILATSFNSLLSKYFGISKRQIVLLKMQGAVSQDDLLIGLSLSKVSGTALKHFLDLRKQNKPWQQIILDPILTGQQLSPILKRLHAGSQASLVSKMIANDIISLFFTISPETISQLRANGFSEKEITLLAILSSTSNKSIERLASQRSKEAKSWSEIANLLDVEPKAAGKLILNFTPK